MLIQRFHLPLIPVREQIAMGIPLHRQREIRMLYGEDASGTSEIAFDAPEHSPVPHGHVIAARITSERPEEGFRPTSGTVAELNFRASKHVWGYFAVATAGAAIHEFADSQFGHLFAFGEDREQAKMYVESCLDIQYCTSTLCEYYCTIVSSTTVLLAYIEIIVKMPHGEHMALFYEYDTVFSAWIILDESYKLCIL